jgi:hypothetical protein
MNHPESLIRKFLKKVIEWFREIFSTHTHSTSDRRAPPPEGWVLVLVVNAKHASLLEALQCGTDTGWDRDQLYEATQALWVGTVSDFEQKLEPWFKDERSVQEPSEYDVHLVCIALTHVDAGLRRDTNSLDRLDAFRRLKMQGGKVHVSPRLSSEAYGAKDVFYSK